jgi:hypothetical protein
MCFFCNTRYSNNSSVHKILPLNITYREVLNENTDQYQPKIAISNHHKPMPFAVIIFYVGINFVKFHDASPVAGMLIAQMAVN